MVAVLAAHVGLFALHTAAVGHFPFLTGWLAVSAVALAVALTGGGDGEDELSELVPLEDPTPPPPTPAREPCHGPAGPCQRA